MKKKFKIILFTLGCLTATLLFLFGIGFIHYNSEDEAVLILTNETDNTTEEIPLEIITLEDGTKIYKLGNVLISANEITSINKSI